MPDRLPHYVVGYIAACEVPATSIFEKKGFYSLL